MHKCQGNQAEASSYPGFRADTLALFPIMYANNDHAPYHSFLEDFARDVRVRS